MLVAVLHRRDNRRQQSVYSFYATVQSQLSEKEKVVDIDGYIMFVDQQQNSYRHRQIKTRSDFSDIGGR